MKKKLSILVIDDETALEDIYVNFLAKIGASVTFCDHPQKGWKAIDKEEYDLIITDLQMPVISGDEFISIVRASKLNAHTPIILCSAFINKLVITEMTRESKVYFLSKPIDSKTLQDLVIKAVSVKKSDATENLTLIDKWLQSFSSKLGNRINEQIIYSNIDQFELWNFESISLNFYIMKENEYLFSTLIMKQKTFLKIAGKLQGTQYTEIESETLNVWQELLESILKGTGRVTFSKLLSQEIISPPGQKGGFYKISTSSGEIQVYFN